MPLKSRIFRGDPALEACLVRDSAHVSPGAQGNHVARIQAAIMVLDDVAIADSEIKAEAYGPSTASAVLNYKKKRKIINFSYQTQADNIVGKMTIQHLDDELVQRQEPTSPQPQRRCRIDPLPTPYAATIDRFLAARRE